MSAAEMREAAAKTVGEAALEHMFDRRGIKSVLEAIRDEDPKVWAEIVEATGRAAVRALPLPHEEGMVERVGAAALQILFHLRETKWTVGPIHDDEPELWAAIVKEAGAAAIAAMRGEK